MSYSWLWLWRFWSAAGIEAPRRFGFGVAGTDEFGVPTTVRRRSKARSTLRSAGALQKSPRLGKIPDVHLAWCAVQKPSHDHALLRAADGIANFASIGGFPRE
jgi:hypothetical protein